MSRRHAHELDQRIQDREEALRLVGIILTDPALTPKKQIERCLGILTLYGCEPKRYDAPSRTPQGLITK